METAPLGHRLLEMKSGILYSADAPKSSGQLPVAEFIRKLKTIAYSLRYSGAALLCLAFVGVVWIYLPLAYYEVRYQVTQNYNLKFKIFNQLIKNSKFKNKNWEAKPTWVVPDVNYSLYIPKINAISRVIPSVDAGNPAVYLAALKQGVAEAGNLAHPGQRGTTYLFAHSTDSSLNFARYNAVFYLLDKVKMGDRVEVVYHGQLYKYTVLSKAVLMAQDTQYLVPQGSEERLILQTCYPPGTTWKRLVVVATRS